MRLIVTAMLAVFALPAAAQINKALVEAAPQEERAPMPHIDPDDPTRRLIKQDASTNIWREERPADRNPDREAGPIDIQRYQLQMEQGGIKTFFQLPVALTQEDLRAGEVDVAIFGAPTGALPHSAGNMWAPAQIRFTRDYGGYGDPKFPLSWVEYETLINPFASINAVDYGDTGMNPYDQSATLEEIRRVTREIAETGAIPFAIGGDHSVPNGTFRGIVDVYGRKNVAFVHFDAHLDRGKGKFGMSTPVFGQGDWDQILEEGGTVFHIHEIQRDGVDKTFKKLYKVLEDVDLVYISFDIDVFDMSYAPGTGSSSPTGMTPNELFPQLREFAATKTIVGMDIVEFNPFYDNKGQQTARLVRRVMLQLLTGISMKKDGIDPEYVNPRVSGKP